MAKVFQIEYCAVSLSEEVASEQFFDAPTVMTSWKQ